MSVGTPITKAALDGGVSDVAASLREALRRTEDLATKVANLSQQELRDLGYDQGVTGPDAGPDEYLLRLLTETMFGYLQQAEGGTPPTQALNLMALIAQVV